MGAKRALIVDDSRSARAFLSRILEKYEFDVDSAESAEQAIEYLGQHRPDVIFMDHMMPGMDGFQAVKAIKNNPRTAMIPIMMYTSQEGELYLGQARALGAIGVLPKQIKPADVSKVLYELHLVPERRTVEQSVLRPVAVNKKGEVSEVVEIPSAGPPPAPTPSSKPLTEGALRELFADLRRALVTSLDSQTDRISADMRQMLQGQEGATPIQPFEPMRSSSFGSRPWGWIIAAVASIFAVAVFALLWQAMAQQRSLVEAVDRFRESTAAANTRTPNVVTSVDVPSSAAKSAFAKAEIQRDASPASGIKPILEPFPYGVEPLSGSRLDAARQLFSRLAAQGFRGVVDIRVYPGRFCLTGNNTEGFSLAPDEMPYAKCDVVGSAPDDSFSATRMPIAFANLIGAFRNATRGAGDVQVSAGDVAVTAVPYPQASESLTAGEWNRAGSANNRVEIRVR